MSERRFTMFRNRDGVRVRWCNCPKCLAVQAGDHLGLRNRPLPSPKDEGSSPGGLLDVS